MKKKTNEALNQINTIDFSNRNNIYGTCIHENERVHAVQYMVHFKTFFIHKTLKAN